MTKKFIFALLAAVLAFAGLLITAWKMDGGGREGKWINWKNFE